MIKKAGLGIAFKASKKVQKHADLIIDEFKEILKHI
jgi:phosphoserine phosphatase